MQPARKLSLVSNDLYSEMYPESWYALAPSRKVRREGRIPVDAFGKRLVVWRSKSGEVHAQQRFCPHMGASLACGDVEGERIVCPFHRWEYDARGACTKIPYMDDARIPQRARLETFPTVERYGFIWGYNGAEPSHPLPIVPELESNEFSIRKKTQRFAAHPLLMLENGCDAQHFKFVHRVPFEHYEARIVTEAPHAFAFDVIQRVRTTPSRTLTITTHLAYAGASMICGRLLLGERLFAVFIAAPTPIGPKLTDFTLIVAVKKLPRWLAPLNPIYASLVARQIFTGATDDYLPIWKEMDPTFRKVLVEEDTLQQRFRRYYRAHLDPAALEATP